MTLRVAEFNNRTMYQACAFVTAPLAISRPRLGAN